MGSYIRFAAPGKIVALVQSLRREQDKLLLAKILDPNLDLNQSNLLHAIAKVLQSDGLTQK